MTYAVTVDAEIPAGAPALDALQCEGAVSLLERHFEALGPDGPGVTLLGRVIAGHPRGALLKVVVDAPGLEPAEDAVHAVVTEVLVRSGLLAHWVVTRCEVQLHDGIAQESLDAADGPDAPPSDLAERARRHAARAHPAGGPDAPGSAGAEADAMRRRLRAMAPQLRAFPHTAGSAAEIAAGALVYGVHLLVDELFADLGRLEPTGPGCAGRGDPFLVLDDLPAEYTGHYDVLFVRRLVTTAVTMTGRLAQPLPAPPACPAERLLMRLLLDRAEATADLYGLLDAEVRTAFGDFAAGLDATTAPSPVADWFTPLSDDRFVHPYAAEDGEEDADEDTGSDEDADSDAYDEEGAQP
ncbi:hypothetical protein [Streptomyces sp. NRRL F-5123]|uniref:hypothetical protein n=1 Tax=Streptomyces sp. NRRL F-5123 TaxID=1463856 RepID=UPI00069418F5|nr:hypothetical protein [Streptomyces sp. NRRL F-5123]